MNESRSSGRRRIDAGVRPLILDLGCCGTSAWQIGAPEYGLPGFDGNAYDLEPEQANVLIVAGRVPRQCVPLVRSLYDRLAAPKWVIAYGVCAVSGAVFDTSAVAEIIPVDFAVGGCPPHTDTLCRVLARLPRRRKP